MADPTLIRGALWTKLAASSGLITALGGTLIYEGLAPQGTSPPYVVFNWQGGGLENLTPSLMVNEVWTVQGLATNNLQAGTISNLVFTALHKSTLTVSGWTNFELRAEEKVSYVEIQQSGEPIYHEGHQYRIRLGD